MLYVGIDVHAASSTYCTLDGDGDVVGRGRVPTTREGFEDLVAAFRGESLRAGQEVGSFAYFVHDTLSELGVELLSFNAQHLRMIASSRKKSDRRDAYWIARSLQTGLTPHPVFLPGGTIRALRSTLRRRELVKRDRSRWVLRARGALKTIGIRPPTGRRQLESFLASETRELPQHIRKTLFLCERQIDGLSEELDSIDAELRLMTQEIAEIRRLITIPGIGWWTATVLHAWIADISRFPTARHLASYAGVVPSVRQSGQNNYLGHITKEGAPMIRAALIQSAHAVMRSASAKSAHLRDVFDRVRGQRGRYKIAIVALARHLLRIAFYVLRDGTKYHSPHLVA